MPNKIYCCKRCNKEFVKKKLANGLIPSHCADGSKSLCKVNDKAPKIKNK